MKVHNIMIDKKINHNSYVDLKVMYLIKSAKNKSMQSICKVASKTQYSPLASRSKVFSNNVLNLHINITKSRDPK